MSRPRAPTTTRSATSCSSLMTWLETSTPSARSSASAAEAIPYVNKLVRAGKLLE